MSEPIKRWSIGNHETREEQNGMYVLYSDHETRERELMRENISLRATVDHFNAGLDKIFKENEQLRRQALGPVESEKPEFGSRGDSVTFEKFQEMTKPTETREGLFDLSLSDRLERSSQVIAEQNKEIEQLRAQVAVEQSVNQREFDKAVQFVAAENQKLRAALDTGVHIVIGATTGGRVSLATANAWIKEVEALGQKAGE